MPHHLGLRPVARRLCGEEVDGGTPDGRQWPLRIDTGPDRIAVMNEIERHSNVGGWLWLLCLMLIVWGPLQLALTIPIAFAALPVRGPILGILIAVRVALTAFGVAAGMTLYSRKPNAVSLARVSLVATAAFDLFRYHSTYYPSNRMPGDEWIETALSLAYAAAWLTYLSRSRRVRATLDK